MYVSVIKNLLTGLFKNAIMEEGKRRFNKNKRYPKKDSGSSEKRERSFKESRKKNTERYHTEKRSEEMPVRKEKPFKKWEKTPAPGAERPFEKFRKKHTGRKRVFKKEKLSYEKGEENPNRKWEKPSVFFKKRREEAENKTAGYKKKSAINAEPELIRLNKYIANAGLCSRREADTMIENGLVSVNGNIVTQLGTKISRNDVVKYGGETLRKERPVYILLNKPKDYITTVKDTHERKTVLELIKNACKERVYPVGRLDRNTTGVLLLTNDGELTKKLTHPKYGAKKIYHVETDKNVNHLDLKKLTEGVLLEEDGIVKADEASYAGEHLGKNEIGVVLHSGKNRIVRRMFEALGYEVVKLDRVYFAGLTKKDLQRGRWRFLSDKEVGFLKMIK